MMEVLWKPLAVLAIVILAWIFLEHERHEIETLESKVQSQEVQLKQAAATINEQNLAVLKLQAEGKQQQETIEGLALEAQKNAGKVVTQWKTKYVPRLIPEDCSAGIAASAANAASVARIYMNSPTR